MLVVEYLARGRERLRNGLIAALGRAGVTRLHDSCNAAHCLVNAKSRQNPGTQPDLWRCIQANP